MIPGSIQLTRSLPLVPQRVSPYTRAIALIAALRHIPHVVGAWFARVEERRRLAMLDDHILRDIGFTRADVDRALLKPFWRE